MSALAAALLAKGNTVTGSDRAHDEGFETPSLTKLQRLGVRLHSQNGSGITSDTTALIVSTAIEEDNQDLAAARKIGCPILRRAEMLAELVGDSECVAVTGTSGKTTVTGMAGWVLTFLGANPTIVNGGPVLNWVTDTGLGSVHDGRDDFWVVEADESDRSLMSFRPDWAVITNISADHFSMEDSMDLFLDFARNVKIGIISTAEVASMLRSHFGSLPGNRFIEVECNVYSRDSEWYFQIHGEDMKSPLPGRHNAENALLAVALCMRLGYSQKEVGWALSQFHGIERRLQVLESSRDITVIDDYAHNPAKIKAAWNAASAMGKRVLGVWRPHGYGPFAQMADDLVMTFRECMQSRDMFYILDVYYAGGSVNRLITSREYAERLRDNSIAAEYVEGYERLDGILKKTVEAGDVVLFMGARDHELPLFARRFAEDLKSR